MGSATREALASAVATLHSIANTIDLATGEQLLEAARIIGTSSPLRAALADHAEDGPDKRGIVGALFGSFTPAAQEILVSAVSGRWSDDKDLVAGIEELGIRALVAAAGPEAPIESELFAFERAVSKDSELELAVSSQLGTPESKAALVQSLLGGKASAHTIAIVLQLVKQPRGRRIGEMMRFATRIVADQSGLAVATVTSATPLSSEQADRLIKGLGARYGRGFRLNQVIAPDLIGGVRIQIGDDVIDGSVATKINDLRLQLAR